MFVLSTLSVDYVYLDYRIITNYRSSSDVHRNLYYSNSYYLFLDRAREMSNSVRSFFKDPAIDQKISDKIGGHEFKRFSSEMNGLMDFILVNTCI